MNRIRVCLYMTDILYAKALARGFSQSEYSFDITICGCENPADDLQNSFKACDVVLTDMDGSGINELCPDQQKIFYMSGKTGPSKNNPDEAGVVYKFEKVSVLSKKIMSKFKSITGNLFFPSNERGFRTFAFTSNQGGSGTTVISLTAARLMAERETEKVLYINMAGYRNYACYAQEFFSYEGVSRQLEYCLEKSVPFQMNDYISKDKYGLFHINFPSDAYGLGEPDEKRLERLFDTLERQSFFNIVIVDLGSGFTGEIEKIFNSYFIIENARDLRSSVEENSRPSNINENANVRILNNGSITGERNEQLEIEHDKESFRVSGDDSIEISLDKSFATGVLRIVEKCR